MSVSSAGRVALYLQDKHPIPEAVEYVRHAEERGFEAVWQAESRLVREATVPMAAFAASTRRIGVASGVVNCWTRNVGLLAATFVTLDDLAPGRIVLGIGAWWDPLASKVGIRRTRPLVAMRETVEVTRRLMAMERVTFHGEFVHVDDIEIDVVHGRREPRDVPVYIGATGDRMLALSGEIADGVLLNYLVSPEYDRRALVALDRARELVTQYLGQQPHIMQASGVDQSLLDEIARILTWPAGPEEIEKAMALVPDEVVQMITASGTAEECRAKVRKYVEAGCTCPVLYPLGDDVPAMIDAFAPGAS
jgi:5,10-methylenetetrahydromethanopterin reductase